MPARGCTVEGIRKPVEKTTPEQEVRKEREGLSPSFRSSRPSCSRRRIHFVLIRWSLPRETEKWGQKYFRARSEEIGSGSEGWRFQFWWLFVFFRGQPALDWNSNRHAIAAKRRDLCSACRRGPPARPQARWEIRRQAGIFAGKNSKHWLTRRTRKREEGNGEGDATGPSGPTKHTEDTKQIPAETDRDEPLMGFANGRIVGRPLRLIASGGRGWGLLIADRGLRGEKIPNLSSREGGERAKQQARRSEIGSGERERRAFMIGAANVIPDAPMGATQMNVTRVRRF